MARRFDGITQQEPHFISFVSFLDSRRPLQKSRHFIISSPQHPTCFPKLYGRVLYGYQGWCRKFGSLESDKVVRPYGDSFKHHFADPSKGKTAVGSILKAISVPGYL
jgi:hypothetical protein